MCSQITIGLTGGIGSGKSVVSRFLRCNGFEVYDCDSMAKKLMTCNEDLKTAICEMTGPETYYPSGELNRKYLSKLIFNDTALRNNLNSVVHECVRKDIEEKRKIAKKIFFVESAILMTASIDKYCDNIWLIEAPVEVKIKRVNIRDGLDKDEIIKRMKIQEKEINLLPDFKTIKLINDGIRPLFDQVFPLLNEINVKERFNIEIITLN